MKNKKMNIVFLSAEITPLAKAGGLGDVAGALPKELKDANVAMLLPFYGLINKKEYQINKLAEGIKIGSQEKINLWQTTLPQSNIPIYLIEHDFFKPEHIYLGGRVQKEKNYSREMSDIKRFAFFNLAVLEAVKFLNIQPDIVHINDWHFGPIPELIKNDSYFKKTKTVYTIHNLANQGIADSGIVEFLKLNPGSLNIKNDLKNNDINFMAQGVIGADIINTVSPTYAKEILTAEYGAGLENVLKKRKKNLYGILNGIDIDFFNPETDRFLTSNYSIKVLNKKTENKLALQKKLGLPEDVNVPLVGFVSRFVWQKGVDLITEEFSNLNCQFVFLGTGEEKYEKHLEDLAKKYPEKFSAQIKFDEALAHEIYAASDMFLVPSRFEPCGLTQMIAMRYGAVPVVRKTGGLADTVNSKNGFVFKKFTPEDLYKTLVRAIKKYNKPSVWKKFQLKGMKEDFSWNNSAKKYLTLYKKALKIKG